MKTLASFLLVVGLGGVASANGFLLNEFDARAVGRGNATTATETDPSAIYYNVGGLAAGEGTNVIISGSLVGPNASFFDPASGVKTESATSPQPLAAAFGSYHITDMVAVGLGFYTPFGLAIDWPDSSPQNNVAQNVALHTFFITPAVGLNLGSFVPGLSVGAGIDLVPATIELKQAIYVGDEATGCGGTTPSCAHLGATAFGVGGRIGAMYRPEAAPRLSIGVMWRSAVSEDFSGTANFDTPPEFRSMLPADGDAKTSLTLPQTVSGGVAYRPVDNLEVEADVIWTNWSTFKELDITVPNPPMQPGTMQIKSAQNYSNTTSVRVGADYKLPLLNLAVRAGFIWDPTPVPSTSLTALLPDVDRKDVTLGASYQYGKVGLHAGLLFVLPTSRTTSSELYTPQYKGTFDVSAWVASLSLSAKLGS